MTTTYSTDAEVKVRLSISVSEFDTEIDAFRVTAYSEINSRLSPYVTTPIAAPTQEIAEIEADWAAGIFKEARFAPTRGTIGESSLRKRAMKNLDEFTIVNYQVTKRVPPTKFATKATSTNTWDET